jgi:hypothetical protein
MKMENTKKIDKFNRRGDLTKEVVLISMIVKNFDDHPY